MLHAFGAAPALAVVVLAYFVGQVGNTIPIPGAVSGGIIGVLLAFGVDADLALVSVLAYRAVAIWLPASIGLAALGRLRRTVARWTREDAPHAATPAPRDPRTPPHIRAHTAAAGSRAGPAAGGMTRSRESSSDGSSWEHALT
jgi:hypothetical protein